MEVGYQSKFRYISNGEIEFINVTYSDAATYKLSIGYLAVSGISPAETSVSVTVNNCGKCECRFLMKVIVLQTLQTERQ